MTDYPQFDCLVRRTALSKYLYLLLCFVGFCHADNPVKELEKLDKSGFILIDAENREISSFKANTPYIPASTTKLVTALLALQHWGETHRFETSFYIDATNSTLWIRGGGDPFLVSEELQIIAQQIRKLHPSAIQTIALDTSLFEPALVVPGAGNSNNPYDALPTALACNFNTINLKLVDKVLESAEPQTPLTPYSRTFAGKINQSTLRINTGQDAKNSERYFAEVLRELLRKEGAVIGDDIIWGMAPDRRPDYTHRNSRTLGEVIQLMLKYSTNFIANELILTLVAEHFQKPASFTLVSDYMNSELFKQFGWQNFYFEEGAGLSPQNRLSAQQLAQLLQTFKPWSDLMPEVQPGVYAKTGTLENVQTLAGYIQTNGDNHIFAVLINGNINTPLANDMATELKNSITR
ncbi:MAG: D-alanyl-D-alanine carboxypeptidase [Granulosicoccus sp.]|nr:D-alanyl-D-alanine carboxypeptidase [Granulosicoccus sp.]